MSASPELLATLSSSPVAGKRNDISIKSVETGDLVESKENDGVKKTHNNNGLVQSDKNNSPAHSSGQIDADHPRGDEIRRQVEFYFSDENLPTDIHLLEKCNGRANEPVPLKSILGFKKMRSYKPKTLVITALRKSTFLEVSQDGKSIKRKVPLQGKCALDPDFNSDLPALEDIEDPDIAYDPRARLPPTPPPQQPTFKAKPISKNMAKPTGFEPNFTEPLLTPAEAAEELALYSPSKSFVERIEIAIQRFRQKRRMHQMYAQVFDKLMAFGGVESGPRVNQGVTQKELAEMDAEQRALALATMSVPWERGDESLWEVDFEGVAASFLTINFSTAPTSTITTATRVLRSFYNYLLYHTVCPEHTSSLTAALALCDTAAHQLPLVQAAGAALPGPFNTAASVLFGGTWAGLYVGDQEWVLEGRKEGIEIVELGMRAEEARVIFSTALAVFGSEESFLALEAENMQVIADAELDLRIVEIEEPDAATREAFIQHGALISSKTAKLEALGKVVCEVFTPKSSEEWDLPPPPSSPTTITPFPTPRRLTLHIESSLLRTLCTTMQLRARILTLTGGLVVLDEVKQIRPGFHQWIANEIWVGSAKKVRWLEGGGHGKEGAERREEDGGEGNENREEDGRGSDEED